MSEPKKKPLAIYLVETPTGNRLIKASGQSAAINFAVRSKVKARAITAAELSDAIDAGLKIEDASKEEEPKPEEHSE